MPAAPRLEEVRNYHFGVFWKWQAMLEQFPDTCRDPSSLLDVYFGVLSIENLFFELIVTLILLLGLNAIGLIA